MCGITGKLYFDPTERVTKAELGDMLQPILHRGPDGNGIHLDANVGLGHCRLSIIDLSTGDQPMANEDETIWIVFNGEIYNFEELREQLLAKGHLFRSRCDTEVIIHLYEELGPDCVQKLRGMFAFAIWDSKRRRLFLARDRVGIKPLYFCQTGRALYFASELKSIMADPGVAAEINLPAIRRFLSFHYLPGEETLFRSVRKLLPGHWLLAENGTVTTRQYWDLNFTRDRAGIPFDKAAEELYGLLCETIHDHMIADVPVGVLLSGGVDSSAVLSFAVQSTPKQVRTFTVGFNDPQVVDERPYARLAAQRFGTEHHDLSISAQDFWAFLPSYVWHMEEPVCEPPAVALYYVSRLARHFVKVLLSGEGGDEAFAGYSNYPNQLWLDRIRRALGPLARPTGGGAALAGRLLGSERVHRYGAALGRPLNEHYFSRTADRTGLFHSRADQVFTPGFLKATESAEPERQMAEWLRPAQRWPLLDQMLYTDTKTWLPDDLLVKADKMTMATSLELRVPLLDHRVLEFAASLPPEYKVKKRQGKRLLKAAFSKVLPSEVLERKKAGFPVPYDRWMRTELKDGVEDTLRSQRAVNRGYFCKPQIERVLEANARDGCYAKEVFCLLVLELWFQAFSDKSRAGH